MQNNPHFFFWKQGFPKGGEGGGGPDLGEKSPNNPVFFFLTASLMMMIIVKVINVRPTCGWEGEGKDGRGFCRITCLVSR